MDFSAKSSHNFFKRIIIKEKIIKKLKKLQFCHIINTFACYNKIYKGKNCQLFFFVRNITLWLMHFL